MNVQMKGVLNTMVKSITLGRLFRMGSCVRILSAVAFLCLAGRASAQVDAFTSRYNYTFIEDSSLVPMSGEYTVEYLARGQWWSYMDPRTPVNYAGKRMELKPVFIINGAPIMVVEVGKDYITTDSKLRVVRDRDTMIVDLAGNTRIEDMMLVRTARVGVPPRPPVILPFRSGWYDLALLDEPMNEELTQQFDVLWMAKREEVHALFDTARYEFTLLSDGLRVGPLEIHVSRDPNYTKHLLHFPSSGPGAYFELYGQDSLGVAEHNMNLRVDMPLDGETGKWVDVTDLRYGRYSAYLKWGDQQSSFYLTFNW